MIKLCKIILLILVFGVKNLYSDNLTLRAKIDNNFELNGNLNYIFNDKLGATFAI